MKKTISILLAGALALSLAACGKTQATGSVSFPTESAQSQLPVQEPLENPGLRLANQSSETGFFSRNLTFSSKTDHRHRLGYVDYAAATENILCADSTCTHETDSCTAVAPKEGTWCAGITAVNNDTMIYVLCTLDHSKGGVYTMHKDGTDFKTLAETGPGIDFFGIAALDEHYVYIFCGELNEDMEKIKNFIGKVPLSGGDLQEVAEVEAGCSGVGTDGRSLILQLTNTKNDMDFVGLDLDTGEMTPLFTWQSKGNHYIGIAKKQADKIYGFTDETAASLHWSSLDGSSGDIELHWPQEMSWAEHTSAVLELVTPDAASVVLYAPDKNIAKRYTITLADGSVKENTLTMKNNGEMVGLVGFNQDTALIEILYQDEWSETVGEDGTPQDELTIISRLAVMPLESFLAGSTDYTEIQPLTEGGQEP